MMMIIIILVYCLLWHFNSILQLLSAMLSIYLFHHLAILATTLINACLLVQWHVPLPKCCKKLLPHAKVSLKSGNRLLSYDRKRFSIWPPSAIINLKKTKNFRIRSRDCSLSACPPICWCCLDRGPGSFDVEDAIRPSAGQAQQWVSEWVTVIAFQTCSVEYQIFIKIGWLFANTWRFDDVIWKYGVYVMWPLSPCYSASLCKISLKSDRCGGRPPSWILKNCNLVKWLSSVSKWPVAYHISSKSDDFFS